MIPDDYDDFPDPPDLTPFFTEALPCESCGHPCDVRVAAAWDPDLQVGPCCEFCIPDFEIPCTCVRTGDQEDVRGCELHDPESELNRLERAIYSQPLCRPAMKDISECSSIGEVRAIFEFHRQTCPECYPDLAIERREVQSETRKPAQAKEKSA